MGNSERDNSFTFLRLVFALSVVFSHSFTLGGFGLEPLLSFSHFSYTLGSVAVLCFFVLSGFLITASAERQPCWRFFLNRGARILPGFWTVQVFTALILAPSLLLLKHDWIQDYWHALNIGLNSPLSYLFQNAGVYIQQPGIADLFRGQPGPPLINGSLWSLWPELTCYVYLGLFAAAGGLRRAWIVGVTAGLLYTLYVTASLKPSIVQPLADWSRFGGLFGLESALNRAVYMGFVSGMTFYRFRHLLRYNALLCSVSAILFSCSLHFGFSEFVWPLTLPYLLLYAGKRLPLRSVERYGDYSYGIYIYSFPIQQCLTMWGVNRLGAGAYVGLSLGSALLAGAVSWFLIEAPILRWARQFRRASTEETALDRSHRSAEAGVLIADEIAPLASPDAVPAE